MTDNSTPAKPASCIASTIVASERSVTDEGVELTFAVDYLGPWLLTSLLMPRLVESATSVPSRVINVSSIAHARGRIHLDDLRVPLRPALAGDRALPPYAAPRPRRPAVPLSPTDGGANRIGRVLPYRAEIPLD